MEDSKKIIFGILLVSIFVLVVAVSSLYVQTEISSGNACGCFIPIPLFIPFISSIGLFIGTMVYYLLSPRFKANKIEKKSLLKFLEGDERKIFSILLEEKEINQADLVRNSGLSKVKISRILKKLQNRGILEKKSIGKVNMVKLNKEISDLI